MTNALTMSDLLVLGGAIASGLGGFQILIWLGDRLWGKRPHREGAEQSAMCSVQHSELRGSVEQLAKHMQAQTDALNRTASALSEQAHADQLRHQALIAKLDLMNQQHAVLHNDVREIKRRVEA